MEQQSLQVASRDFIPEVNLDPETNHFWITGDSYHEYTYEFYEPIFQWLRQYLSKPVGDIRMDFRMTYFNTASSKCLFDIIEILFEYQSEEYGSVEVNWFYKEDDEDMYETGQDYIQDLGRQINMVPYEADDED
jgi:hypothetical protein